MHVDVSEMFFSLEGEGPYTNRPTLYLRLAKCNFKCSGFNNPKGIVDKHGYAILTFNPKDFITTSQLPMIETGCDSQYAVNPAFSHTWLKLTASEIMEKLSELAGPEWDKWVHKTSKQKLLFSLTGGEPTMHQKWWPQLFTHPDFVQYCNTIILETNGAVPMSNTSEQTLWNWLSACLGNRLVVSVSPKLANSGESETKAIQPNGITFYQKMQKQLETESSSSAVEMYMKFVSDGTEKSLNNIQRVIGLYSAGGVDMDSVPIWIMPEACTDEQQNIISRRVALMCMKNGYNYSHRTQNSIWGNGVGC